MGLVCSSVSRQKSVMLQFLLQVSILGLVYSALTPNSLYATFCIPGISWGASVQRRVVPKIRRATVSIAGVNFGVGVRALLCQ